ncbi:nitrilase-related carbon-nitrogen hydrolase [Rhizomicrobium electricum]|uniref:Apolipoprotein N-acyltransferase n=1 Tax=Rhizomicrobium electricum TaxID=480070 RepID=A0ABN1F2Y6_9PROT|nr:nitrilase-related carbon-nitrogen hydrolase [Rhizomicrobium electricum]NIJ49261.1 apolipoprotein N-acyltransferase [Rhizomicrobium electricum]
MTRLIPWLCAALSGLLMFFSMGLAGTVAPGLGVLWVVALLAPVPVLWFAFRAERGWAAFLAAFAASALGACNILPAYAGVLPPAILVPALLTPALGFALAVAGARFVVRRVAPISGAVAFAALWTGVDYLLSLGPNGAASSPAYAQIGMPAMLQIASVFGLWGITFVVALFAAALAMFAATKERTMAVLAVAVLALDLGYGAYRLQTAPERTKVTVGLAADDTLVPLRFKEDETSALKVVKAYAGAGKTLAQQRTDLIVIPERVAVLKPEWRGTANADLETVAHGGHTAVVMGFDDRTPPRSNAALYYFANGAAPIAYAKRHLIPGLESVFEPGKKSFMTSEFTGVAVCKDMDFPASVRTEAVLQPSLYAVPAWDFDKDGAWHARLAIMRGVENGFAVARAANNGLLTVSDAYGRVIAAKATAGGGMVTLRAEVARGPGRTLYADIGDGLAYIALAMSFLLLVVAVAASKRAV